MLVSTATEEVRARIGELTADFWTSNEVYRALNEGLKRFSAQERWPWLFTRVTNGSLSASTEDFALPENVDFSRFFHLQVYFSGDSRPYMPRRVTPAEAYRLMQSYYTDTAYPVAYFISAAADSDLDGQVIYTITFVPAMTRAATLKYTYLRTPAIVDSSDDLLDIPEQYAMGVVAYATGLLWLKELQDGRKAEEQFALYQSVVDDAKRESRRLGSDEDFSWGKSEPEYGWVDDGDYTYRHFSGALGA
jgi:hypothetical protein